MNRTESISVSGGFGDRVSSVRSRAKSGTKPISKANSTMDLDMMKKHLEEKQKVKEKVYDLIFYLLFMVVFLTSLFLARNIGGSWEIEAALKDGIVDETFPPEFSHIFKNFESIGSYEEFWQWVDGPLVKVLGENKWYNGDKFTSDESGYIYLYNKMIGGIRMRQLRVRDDTCVVTTDMKKVVGSKCYGEYNQFNAQTTPMKRGGYKYKTQAETGIPGEYGRATFIHYDGGGYIADIPGGNTTGISTHLKKLQDELFLDQQTRVVFITINVFNGNLNHFALANLMVEVTPAGILKPFWQFKIFKLEPYEDTRDYVRLGTEGLLVIFLIYFVVKEVQEIIHLKFEYFLDPWNVIDVLNLSVFWCAVFMNIAYFANPLRSTVTLNTNEYVNLEGLANEYVNIFSLQSFNVLLTFFKSFKFLQISKTMTLLWDTLGRAAGDLFAFMIFFSIVFLGFASMGHVVFGPTVETFKDFGGSFMTCFQIILGEFDYDEIHRANRVLGPSFFLVFIILVYFALVNMFLAIINDAYKIQHALLGGETLRDQLRSGLSSFWKGLKSADASKLSDSQLLKYIEKSDLSTKEGILTLEEIKQTLGADLPEEIAERLLNLWNKMQEQIKKEKMAALFESAGASATGSSSTLNLEKKLQVLSELEKEEEDQLAKLEKRLEQVSRQFTQ